MLSCIRSCTRPHAITVVFLASKSFSWWISFENQPPAIYSRVCAFFDEMLFVPNGILNSQTNLIVASAKFVFGWKKFAVFLGGPPASAISQLLSCLIIKHYLEAGRRLGWRDIVSEKFFDTEFLSDWTPVHRKTRLRMGTCPSLVEEGKLNSNLQQTAVSP